MRGLTLLAPAVALTLSPRRNYSLPWSLVPHSHQGRTGPEKGAGGEPRCKVTEG